MNHNQNYGLTIDTDKFKDLSILFKYFYDNVDEKTKSLKLKNDTFGLITLHIPSYQGRRRFLIKIESFPNLVFKIPYKSRGEDALTLIKKELDNIKQFIETFHIGLTKTKTVDGINLVSIPDIAPLAFLIDDTNNFGACVQIIAKPCRKIPNFQGDKLQKKYYNQDWNVDNTKPENFAFMQDENGVNQLVILDTDGVFPYFRD